MTTKQTALDLIRANAALVRSVVRKELGQEIAFDEEGVRWLDGYVQRQHQQGDRNNPGKLAQVLGSYLGECIVECFGGEWAEEPDGTWGVRFSEGNVAFPFAKVEKHLLNGASDSVRSFFEAIPLVFKLHRRR